MPQPTNPPSPKLPESVFDALSPMSYDSDKKAFKDTGGTYYWMWVQAKSTSEPESVEWIDAKDSEGGSYLRCDIPQGVYDVISGGEYNASASGVDYEGGTYVFRLRRNTSTNTAEVEKHEV